MELHFRLEPLLKVKSRVTAVSSEWVQHVSNMHQVDHVMCTSCSKKGVLEVNLQCEKGFVDLQHQVSHFTALYTSVKLRDKYSPFVNTDTCRCPWHSALERMFLSSVITKTKLRVAEKNLATSMNYIILPAPREQRCPVLLIHGYTECIQKVSLLRFCFQTLFSFCCQQSKPKFSGDQVETFSSSIKRFAFSADVVYLSAFTPPTFEIK